VLRGSERTWIRSVSQTLAAPGESTSTSHRLDEEPFVAKWGWSQFVRLSNGTQTARAPISDPPFLLRSSRRSAQIDR
jgi:hypothetical protein